MAAPASAPLPTPDQEEARRAELEAKLHQRLRQRRAHGPDLSQNDGLGTEALYRAIATEVGCHNNTVTNSPKRTAPKGNAA
ncbi:hypothetical protein ACFRJ1_18640 [Streptomyces sp. NPDC056773]|uniref:hypothetical protein n=1 Tax=unclassified Streptomyces TaxID=2593676 RepID=UPI0036A3D96B